MDGESGPAASDTNNASQQRPKARSGGFSRSISMPLASPREALTRHQRNTHDSFHPSLFNPAAVIQPKEPNENAGDIVSQTDKLADFRRLIGIDSSPNHINGPTYHRPAENIGIYTHIVRKEVIARAQYTRFSLLINTSLGAQLIVAATLTALGAGGGPRGAVTTFGAINTVLAGILTFLKGSGLPNRKKYYANEWTKIREYIEQRERQFGREGCTLDVDTEVHQIETMYNEIKQDIEANTPDGYASVATVKKLAAGGTAGFGMTNEKHEGKGMLNGAAVTPGGLEAGIGPRMGVGLGSETGAGMGPDTRMSGVQQNLPTGPGSGTEPTSHPGAASQPPHPPESLLSKLADRLSGSSATGQGGSEHLGTSHVFDTALRLSQKMGAGNVIERLQHLEHAHDTGREQLNRGVDQVADVTNTRAEQLAAAGSEAQARGEGIIRDLRGQEEGAIRDVQARSENLRNSGMSSVHGLQERAGGYFSGVMGGLRHEAERLASAGQHARAVGEEAVREVQHTGDEAVRMEEHGAGPARPPGQPSGQ